MFLDIVSMSASRQGHTNPCREYITALTIKDIYEIMLKYRKDDLMYHGKIIPKKDFEKIMVDYSAMIKSILVNGSPVHLPGGIGSIGVEITHKKTQFESSRMKPDKEKKYYLKPVYQILHNKRHLYKRASFLVDIDKHSIEFTTASKSEIINRYLKDNSTYSRTGDFMYKYSRRINYGTY